MDLEEDVASAEERRTVLDVELDEAKEALRIAKARRDEVNGGHSAAIDAEQSATLAADLALLVREYLEQATARWLLTEATQRLADSVAEGPLQRASSHFATLTNGAFTGLESQIESVSGKTMQYLCAVRPNGELLSPDQLSSGTRDQLWLAMRVAAVEEHLDRGIVVPVVLDDVLVNVDDERCQSVFRVLGALAKRTQVILFTHHAHLVDLARAALGPDGVVVTELDARDPRTRRFETTPERPLVAPATRPQSPTRARRQTVGSGDETDQVDNNILAYIQANPRSAKSDVVEALGITEGEWTASIYGLRESKRVIQEGSKRGARYVVAGGE